MKKIVIALMFIIAIPAIVYAQPSSWAQSSVESMKQKGIIPAPLFSEYQKPIQRDEFTAMIVGLYEYARGSYGIAESGFTDIANSSYMNQIAKGNALGIINGTSPTIFNPNGTLTREQAAVIIFQSIEKIQETPIWVNQSVSFGDKNSISSWAMNAVAYIGDGVIMSGTGNNTFNPKGSLTREQAIVIVGNVLGKYGWQKVVDPVQEEKVEDPEYMIVGDVKITIGDTQQQVEELLGKADRIDLSNYSFKWHVYNSDYSKFIMVGIDNGVVKGLYSNTKGFQTSSAKYGDLGMPTYREGTTFYHDFYGGDFIYACQIISSGSYLPNNPDKTEEYIRSQELEIFDLTNAFRVNNDLKPLEWDEVAAYTARQHSQDMADNDYFSHTGLDGSGRVQRYHRNGGTGGASENCSGGRLEGNEVFNGWITSKNHRANMLADTHDHLGVGMASSGSPDYRYRATQLFTQWYSPIRTYDDNGNLYEEKVIEYIPDFSKIPAK